jgi:hypothetical protein
MYAPQGWWQVGAASFPYMDKTKKVFLLNRSNMNFKTASGTLNKVTEMERIH